MEIFLSQIKKENNKNESNQSKRNYKNIGGS